MSNKHLQGGGVKRLFRKVDNKSAEYEREHPGTVRRDGSYIIEEFMPTQGTDVKVYTVRLEVLLLFICLWWSVVGKHDSL